MANLEKKNLDLYFSKVITNKWKETLEFLEVVLILTSSCLDGNELRLHVRFSLWKALNISGGRARGWCLLCHTLCLGLIWAAVPRGAGQRWGRRTSPWVLSPSSDHAVGSSDGTLAESGLCFSCWLRELAQIHEMTFSLLCFWAYKAFSSFAFHFSWRLCQHTASIPHNLSQWG